MYLCDYHIHTRISPDSESTAAEMAGAAIEAGLSEIAFTDHYDIVEGEIYYPGYEGYSFDGGLMREEFERAKSEYGGRVKMLYGIELGQPHHYPEKTAAFMSSHRFDFVIGSLHALKNQLDYFVFDFENNDPDKELRLFFEDMYKMAGCGDYDIVGHLPYPMRYIALARGSCDLRPYTDEITQILKRLIQNGKGIEINTSTLRKGLGFTMPPMFTAKLYKSLGGEIITVGSDAHDPSGVGYGIRDILKQLFEMDFKYFTVYENREPRFVKIEV